MALLLGIELACGARGAEDRRSQDVEELLLAVSINGQRMTQGTLVARIADRLWVRREDLLTVALDRSGRVRPWLGAQSNSIPCTPWPVFPIESTNPQQLLLIEAPAEAFSLTRIEAKRGALTTPMPSPLGGFFNYDVFATHDETRSATNALAEIGVFNGFGVAISNFVRRDLPEGDRTIRLETTWTDDRPEDMTSARAGDLISGAGAWGRAVRFGGVQWATNFATQPGFISLSRPAMQGEAALPSTLELYVNDMLRLKRNVPPGPFSIQDMPVVTGQGEARLVVTDLLGREQVIVAPYYASPRLLDAGLNAYSYEIGAIREDYGLVSNRYGRAMAVGTFRRGMSSHWTAELHAELLEEQQTAGIGSVWLWPAVGVFSASVAGSQSRSVTDGTQSALGGAGSLANVGFQSQHRRVGYGATAQWSTAEFAQLGLERGRPAPRAIAQAFVNVSAGRAGAVSVSYSYQDRRDAERTELINANYGVTLGRAGFLSVSLVRILGNSAESMASLNFTRLLGSRDTGSLFVSKDEDDTRASVRLQRGLPQGEGFGYRMVSGFGEADPREAAVAYQNDIGTYEVGVGQIDDFTSYRGHASGGVALVGTDTFLSRRVDSSFAVVTVPGYEGVQVYRDNQAVARTNEDGSRVDLAIAPVRNQFGAHRVHRPANGCHDRNVTARCDSLSAQRAATGVSGATFPGRGLQYRDGEWRAAAGRCRRDRRRAQRGISSRVAR